MDYLTFTDLFAGITKAFTTGNDKERDRAKHHLDTLAYYLDSALDEDARCSLDLIAMLTDGKLSDVDDEEQFERAREAAGL